MAAHTVLTDKETSKRLKLLFGGRKAKDAEMEAHLADNGVPPGLVKDARAVGITVLTILTLLLQYGPMFVDILRKLIAGRKKPEPPPVGETAAD